MTISPNASDSKLRALLVECAPQEPTGYAINLLKAAALSNETVASEWQIDCLTLRVKDFSEVDDERLRSRKHLSVVSEIVARNPSIVGFSVFVWNVSIITVLTRMLKLARPEIRVLWGGKLVENDWQRLAESCFEIDCLCIGDGETVFPALLESNFVDDDQVPGTVIRRNGSLIKLLPTDSQRETAPPNPYLMGLIDPRVTRTAFIETIRGCRFNCSFCDWGGKQRILFDNDHVKSIIKRCLDEGFPLIAFLDSNFWR